MRNKILGQMTQSQDKSKTLLFVLTVLLVQLFILPSFAAYTPLVIEDEQTATIHTKVKRLIIHGGTVSDGGNGDITFTTNGDITSTNNFSDNRILRADGTGQSIQDSGITIDDSDNITDVRSLTINGTTGNTLIVDSTTFVVDASNGNVGIGTLTPDQKLEVVGQILATSFNGDGSALSNVVATVVADSLDFQDFKDAMSLDATTTINLNGADLNFNGGLLMLDDSTQNVGIGDTSPDLKLDVSSNASVDGIAIDNTLADGDPILSFQLSGTSTFTMGIDDGDSDKFKIGTSAIGTNTRLTIDSSGYIGIGETAPGANLEVNGTVAYTPSAVTNITAGGGITVTRALMRVQGDGGAVNITANPQIADGTDGQMVMLKGESDTNGLTLDDGTGLSLTSGASFTLGDRDTITLIYDAIDDIWIEMSRSNK